MATITTTATGSYIRRLIGAAALDVGTYEEIEGDRSATPQAFLTVLLSSVAAGIGTRDLGGYTLSNVIFVSTVSLLAWAAWALLTFEIGTRLMPEPQTRSDVGELLRTIGFSTAPGFLRVLGALHGGMVPAFGVSAVWMLAAMIVAVRQALDYERTGRAVAVCVVGWVLAIVCAVGIGLAFGPTLQ
jgi:hypothetical protein